MHGELMEFNELLQKQLLFRESQLKHFTEELVALRGPVSLSVVLNSSDFLSCVVLEISRIRSPRFVTQVS